MANNQGPIGVFDSGYGGLTIFKEMVAALPAYDYIYLGDNARTPYGNRSFDTVYAYTLECVRHLFDKGCPLVILACNTASAKALRSIQQDDLEKIGGERRVLGVVRPTTEIIGTYTKTGHIGIFATEGTVRSESYRIELEKFFPELKVYQQSCPMWVPLVENNEQDGDGADYFVEKNIRQLLQQSPQIDTILLACTHYPLLMKKIRQYTPGHIRLVSQGGIVASGLRNYLERHPGMEERCSKNGSRQFYTTESAGNFDEKAGLFLGTAVQSFHLPL